MKGCLSAIWKTSKPIFLKRKTLKIWLFPKIFLSSYTFSHSPEHLKQLKNWKRKIYFISYFVQRRQVINFTFFIVVVNRRYRSFKVAWNNCKLWVRYGSRGSNLIFILFILFIFQSDIRFWNRVLKLSCECDENSIPTTHNLILYKKSWECYHYSW